MPFTDFRTTASWQGAIALGPGLVRLSEELPASEQLGLAWTIQQAMVDLPAAIAADLGDDSHTMRHAAAFRLVAALDLIERIYPALDTADIRAAVDALVEHISSPQFADSAAGAAKAATVATTPAPAAEVAPTPPPASVRVVPDTPASSPATPPNVIIAPPPAGSMPSDQDAHVLADSGQ